MFRHCGVEALFSDEVDNDDTLAFHAQADGAIILSGDKDMLRYTGSTFTVFRSYDIKTNSLVLLELRTSDSIESRHASSPRQIGPPPRTKPEVNQWALAQDGRSALYQRGVATSLTKPLHISTFILFTVNVNTPRPLRLIDTVT